RLDAYYRWWRAGELSATGRCFDRSREHDPARAGAVQGRAAKAAAAVQLRIARDLGGSVFGGNGSLMWVLPVGLTY
ncbi:hypothetical protein B0H14DRAFT_2334332, partial [Mycena olivaceomarginata]